MSAQALLLIGANVVITAFCSIAARLGMQGMEPLPFAVVSLALGSAALVALLPRGGWARLWNPRLLPRLMGVGLLGTSATSLLFFYAGKTVPASRMVLVAQVEILIALAFGAFFLGERISRKQIFASLLVLAGMGLALGMSEGFSFGRGELMILCMPVCFQVSHLLGKSLLAEVDPDVISTGRTFFGLLFLLPLAPFLAGADAWAAPFASPRSIGLILFQGFVLNAFSLWLWYRALRVVELSKITTLILTYPLLTLAIAKLGLGEPVAWSQFLGSALVIAGAATIARLSPVEKT